MTPPELRRQAIERDRARRAEAYRQQRREREALFGACPWDEIRAIVVLTGGNLPLKIETVKRWSGDAFYNQHVTTKLNNGYMILWSPESGIQIKPPPEGEG